MASNRFLSNQTFLARVRDYLTMEAEVRELDAHGRPGRNALEGELQENVFYQFDPEALLAVRQAIEELALEEANGCLVSVFRKFKEFEPHRERYWQLAATIDEVKVLAAGRKPRRHGNVRFRDTGRSLLNEFCMVLYQGKRLRALLLARRERKRGPSEKFAGFYTFSERVIERVRRNVEPLLRRGEAFPEFAQQQAIDRAAKRVQAAFDREKAAAGAAIQQWQSDGERYRGGDFLADLDRSLRRLAQLKSRLPELLQSDHHRRS